MPFQASFTKPIIAPHPPLILLSLVRHRSGSAFVMKIVSVKRMSFSTFADSGLIEERVTHIQICWKTLLWHKNKKAINDCLLSVESSACNITPLICRIAPVFRSITVLQCFSVLLQCFALHMYYYSVVPYCSGVFLYCSGVFPYCASVLPY